MPEQPQWSERTLDMPPQDPWADVSSAATPAGADLITPTVPYPGPAGEPGHAPQAVPFSAGRAKVDVRPPTRSFAADHEPTGTGWPGVAPPRPRHTLADLRRGGKSTVAALFFAFFCWANWALFSGS